MENVTKTFRIFPWQDQAIKELARKHGFNHSEEMRNAISKYIEKSFKAAISKEQADLLHFKARAIFERRKK